MVSIKLSGQLSDQLSGQLKPATRLAQLWCVALLLLWSETGAARSLADILKSKQLRICLYLEPGAAIRLSPATCRDNCQFEGPNYEIAQAFAQSIDKNLQLKVRQVSWDEQFHNQNHQTVQGASYTPHWLASGQCDLYPNHMTRNAWRQKMLDLVTLFPNRNMVLVTRSSTIKTMADLAGKGTISLRATSHALWLAEQNQRVFAANPIHITLTNDPEQNWAALDKGEIDFLLEDSHTALWFTRHRLKNSSVAFPVGAIEEIGWGMKKDDQDLQRAVQSFFEQQKKSEQSVVNQIWQKHFGLTLGKFVGLIKSTQ
jgi:ABC-type amino acid transport substrate-binding protein